MATVNINSGLFGGMYGGMYNPLMGGMYGNGMTYNYNYGNINSQSMMMNGLLMTRNIMNVGGNCGGDNKCVDGYSLYFPCIKTITRGQNVCFEFFIGDNANQDELDLRDLDDLTLSLSGAFGCPYKDYTYPEDIKPLQYENYKEIIHEDFDIFPSSVCELNVEYYDVDFNEVVPNVEGKVGKFFIGSEVVLVADDTPTHIFVGWGKPYELEFDEDCNEIGADEVEYDYVIISNDKEYRFNIEGDTELFAIYRERKSYEIRVSFDNRHSHFEVYVGDKRTYMSDKERDIVSILEGYHFNAVCIPNKSFLDDDFCYAFKNWVDGYDKQARQMVADDENPLLKKDKIMLQAVCTDSTYSDVINIVNDVDVVYDDFKTQYPEENELFDGVAYRKYVENDTIVEIDNVKIAYIDNNGYLYIEDGYIKTNLLDIEDGVKVKVKLKCDTDSVITFEAGETSIPYNVAAGSEFEMECLLRHCNYSFVKISVEGAVYIDELFVYEEIVEDKGKVQLCLPPEDTANMHPGPLYVSGAISVGGNMFGIDKTLMGNINNLKKIFTI